MMIAIFNRFPFLILVLCFGILIIAWCSLITIAVKFRPQAVPVQTSQAQSPTH